MAPSKWRGTRRMEVRCARLRRDSRDPAGSIRVGGSGTYSLAIHLSDAEICLNETAIEDEGVYRLLPDDVDWTRTRRAYGDLN